MWTGMTSSMRRDLMSGGVKVAKKVQCRKPCKDKTYMVVLDGGLGWDSRVFMVRRWYDLKGVAPLQLK